MVYLHWRYTAMRRADSIPSLDASAHALFHTLEMTLLGAATGVDDLGHPLADSDDGLSAFPPDEREMMRNFANAELRTRDADIDAHQLSEAAAAMACEYARRIGTTPELDGGYQLGDTWQDFVKETEADLQQLSGAIVGMGRDPSSVSSQLRVVKRIAHKIKGTAPTIGLPEITQLASYLEWTAHAYQRRQFVSPDDMALTLGRFLELFDVALVATEAGEAPGSELVDAARRLYDSAAGMTSGEGAASESAIAPDRDHHVSVGRGTDPEHPGAREFLLQVESARLDRLMAHLSGLTVNRGAIASAHARVLSTQSDMASAIARLHEKSADIVDAYQLFGASPLNMSGSAMSKAEPTWIRELRGATGMAGQSRDTRNATVPESLNETDIALRFLTEAVADVETLGASLSGLIVQVDQLIEAQDIVISNIQHEATRMRLTPLADLAPRLEVGAKYLASTLGKRVEFSIKGEMTELDHSLIGALADPLKQLVRNAITHGIELPEQRLEAGKPEVGSVWVYAYYAGPEVVIEVGDDGQGINEHALIMRAISAGLIDVNEGRAMPREEALRLVFRPGFSMLEQPGALAGGGVGLDEVATAVRDLKGEITVSRSSDQGAVFQIRVPVTLTTLPALEVAVGERIFTVPASAGIWSIANVGSHLRRVALEQASGASADSANALTAYRLMLRDALISTFEGSGADFPHDSEIPAYALAECLGVSSAQAPDAAIIVHRDGKHIALLADGIGTVRETMVRPLPSYLRRKLIRGVTIRAENGAAAMMVDIGALADQLLSGRISRAQPTFQRVESKRLVERVLIVDDSVTIRRALDQVLKGAGFATALAGDGYEALELMESETPRVIILDIEMPRLNGYELLKIMRGSPQYAKVRVVALTSRAGEQHERLARELGADEYLVKPCPHDTLINTVKRLFTDSE
jgi:chemotaxis protein histidine kinase CheA/CheY-like chemotaxis protein